MLRQILFSNPSSGVLDSLCLLILRLGLGGVMFAAHGWGKFQSFAEKAAMFPDPFGVGPQFSMTLAVFAEAFCSLLVVLGLMTRFACIPIMITMAVAASVIHSADPWNKKELAVIYFIGFLVIMLRGAGQFSLDFHLSGMARGNRR